MSNFRCGQHAAHGVVRSPWRCALPLGFAHGFDVADQLRQRRLRLLQFLLPLQAQRGVDADADYRGVAAEIDQPAVDLDRPRLPVGQTAGARVKRGVPVAAGQAPACHCRISESRCCGGATLASGRPISFSRGTPQSRANASFT